MINEGEKQTEEEKKVNVEKDVVAVAVVRVIWRGSESRTYSVDVRDIRLFIHAQNLELK
jgi:hypothetical protein